MAVDTVQFSMAALGVNGGFDAKQTSQAADANAFDNLVKRLEAANDEPAHSPSPKKIDKADELYKQCEALESFLVKNLLNSMRSTVQKANLIDEGFAGKMYEDMLYDEYAKDFTANANLGFAEIAYLELTGQRGQIINEKF
jgi:flagellar protein FlgJ